MELGKTTTCEAMTAKQLQTRKSESQLDHVYLLAMLRSDRAQIFHLCNGGEFQHQLIHHVFCLTCVTTSPFPTNALIRVTLQCLYCDNFAAVSNNMMSNMTCKIIINVANMIIIHLLYLQCLACENITGLFLPPAADTSETDYQ